MNNENQVEFAPMPDDAVYNYLCSKAEAGAKVVGAKFIIPKFLGPMTPRKIIVVQVEIDGKPYLFEYNYKKLQRLIDNE